MSSRTVGIIRTTIFAILAIAAAILLESDVALKMTVLFAVSAFAEIALLVGTPTNAHDGMRLIVNGFLYVGTVLIAPFLFPTTLLFALASAVWESVRAPRRMHFVVAAALTLLLIASGLMLAEGDRPWPLAISGLAALGAYGYLSRDITANTNKIYNQFSRVLRSSSAVVYEVDLRDERFSSLTGPVRELTGWSPKEWSSMPHRDLIHPEDLDGFWLDSEAVDEDDFIDRKARFRRPDGTWFWLRDISRVVMTDGRPVLYGFAIDVTELEDAYNTIRHQAEHDQLTGLSNRFVLNQVLDERQADQRGERASFALLMVDVDRFKEINDSFGHEVGDDVLAQFANRLRSSVRPEDLVARLGGDEFAIVADNVHDAEYAETVARRVLEACVDPVRVRNIEIPVGLSIGIALSDADADREELLRRADVAMYRAKRDGLSNSVYVGDRMGERISEVVLASNLPTALSRGEFQMWFQPKVNLETAEVIGVEALLRWMHPDLGMLEPKAFLHLIELSSSERDITEMVLDQSLRFLRDSQLAGLSLRVAINVSVRSLYDRDFPALVGRLLERYALDSDHVILEITEQDIMDDPGSGSPPALDALAAMGLTLSIDDFGTGYSSLARLRDLPISEIKIDRRFVTSAPENEDDQVIVRSIIDLAENLGLRVVAEGVERPEERDFLRSSGCTEAQGFLYAAPMSSAAFLQTHRPASLRVIELDPNDVEKGA